MVHEWRSRTWCGNKVEEAKQNGIADASFKRTCETDLLTVDAKRLNEGPSDGLTKSCEWRLAARRVLSSMFHVASE